MLVLSRKVGQDIVMPQQEVTVRVLEIRGQLVRLGITAPRAVAIFRSELLVVAQAGATAATCDERKPADSGRQGGQKLSAGKTRIGRRR